MREARVHTKQEKADEKQQNVKKLSVEFSVNTAENTYNKYRCVLLTKDIHTFIFLILKKI